MSTVTPWEMLANAENALRCAREALSDARDWLASDWPAGTVLTDEEAARRDMMRKAANVAKAAIEEGLHG